MPTVDSIRHLLPIAFIALMLGCGGTRQYQQALDSMRAEMLAIEDRYYELEHDYRRQQDELRRYKERLGEPVDDDPMTDGMPDEGSSYYDPSEFNYTAGDDDFRRSMGSADQRTQSRDRTLARRQGPFRGSLIPRQRNGRVDRDDVEAPEANIYMPSESLTADEFMALLHGGEDPNQEDPYSSDSQLGLDGPSLGPSHHANTSNPSERLDRSNHSVLVRPSSVTETSPRRTQNIANPIPTHLVINPLLTRGTDLDGADGDDGFTLVVEPRNADDLFVPAVGELVVSLIDPEEEGDTQRIGMWRFTPEQVAERMKDLPGQGRGINLTISWPSSVPKHRQLKVFVRLIGDSGEQLETSSNLNISIPGDGQTGWSVRTQPRRESPTSTSIPAIAQEPEEVTAPSQPTSRQINPNRPSWTPYR